MWKSKRNSISIQGKKKEEEKLVWIPSPRALRAAYFPKLSFLFKMRY